MKALLCPWIARLNALLRGLGPFALIELLLPGGSLIVLLWLLARKNRSVRPGEEGSASITARKSLPFFARSPAQTNR